MIRIFPTKDMWTMDDDVVKVIHQQFPKMVEIPSYSLEAIGGLLLVLSHVTL